MADNQKALKRIDEIANEDQYCNILVKVHEGKIKTLEVTRKEKLN
ncbi:MAG: hypothetical protein ACOCT9_01580 [archaeon]